MSQISKQGADAVRKNVERPLRSIWPELENAGLSEKKEIKDAFNHIFRFLEEVDRWDNNTAVAPAPRIQVNGKDYTPTGG